LLLVTVAVALVFSLLHPFPQPQSYHSFADRRGFLGIPNFGDVASNVPFAIVGVWGIIFLASGAASAHFIDQRERWPYLIAFLGLTLTFVGSSYYHLHPDNARLVWDRLPMTLVFMSIVSAIIVERISVRAGLWLLPLLLLIGIASVFQWYASELRGADDLRIYAAVQAYSAVVLLVALLFPSRYALAKALELLDKPIFDSGHVVSGHTLKHLAAAAAGYWILRMLQKRRAIG
jgi:tryptophan-rich sensory protein